MGKIEISIKNPLVTKSLRQNRKPTVFERSFSRLTMEKKDPCKVIPVFIKINNDYKIFGAFTLNIGGSVSFFPDFYKIDNFHLTLNTDFIQKKGHFTKIEIDGSRSRVIDFEASQLIGNDYYHLITFGMDTNDLLMDALSEIKLSNISYTTEEERMKYIKWIEDSVSGGNIILEFPKEDGVYFVQILILPKEKSRDNLAIERTFIEKLLISQMSLDGKTFTCKKTEIPTPEKSDFSIYILTLRIPGKIKGSFGFLMAQNPKKPLPKGVSLI